MFRACSILCVHLWVRHRGETEEEKEKPRLLTKRKQQIWDDQYKKHHGHIASQMGRYEVTFILEETLGPRPETPLLDDIATPEQLQKLEEERQEKDDILDEWHTPPGSPWERSEDQTVDTTFLSWDTDDIDFPVPTSWDEGEEMTEEITKEMVKQTTERSSATESPAEDTESEDSLPKLVCDEVDTTADSGYAFLNTPPSTEEEDANGAEAEEKEKKKQEMYREIDRINEEARMQESTIDFILNMENPNYKEPEPCIGLICLLTGEQ